MALFKRHVFSQNSITEGVIWKNLLAFFFPILLGTFFQQLYNTADAVIVGKFVGKEALAAVGGATGTLVNLVVGFFVGLSSGATVILSQFYGGRRDREVSQAVHTAAALALAGGALFTVLGIAFSPVILRWMGTPADVLVHAEVYVRIYFAGMIPSLIYNVGAGLLRAVGDSRRPLYFLISACMVNIVLDVLLVVGLELGVAGAALATVFSQMVSAVLVVVTLAALAPGLSPGTQKNPLLWQPAGPHRADRLSGGAAIGHVFPLQHHHPGQHQRLRHRCGGRLHGLRQARRPVLDDDQRLRRVHHDLCGPELRRGQVRPHAPERARVPADDLRRHGADERLFPAAGRSRSTGSVHRRRAR